MVQVLTELDNITQARKLAARAQRKSIPLLRRSLQADGVCAFVCMAVITSEAEGRASFR